MHTVTVTKLVKIISQSLLCEKAKLPRISSDTWQHKNFCWRQPPTELFSWTKTIEFLQGAAERAEKQGRLEKKELQEKLESIEAQMQVPAHIIKDSSLCAVGRKWRG